MDKQFCRVHKHENETSNLKTECLNFNLIINQYQTIVKISIGQHLKIYHAYFQIRQLQMLGFQSHLVTSEVPRPTWEHMSVGEPDYLVTGLQA